MKITVIGAAGVRTPLLVSVFEKNRNIDIDIDTLALMDIDKEHLDIIRLLIDLQSKKSLSNSLNIEFTTNAEEALRGTDYVITTFRVGGMEGRVIDESIPLEYNMLGQETTGAGGFAMAARSIPVLKHYASLMKKLCPEAWIINFANPSGILTEYLINTLGWEKTIGICDAPSTMHSMAASLAGISKNEILMDYFGLNHLGWIRSLRYCGGDLLPKFIQQLKYSDMAGLIPFSPEFINTLGMIPNEYLFYYYSSKQAVTNIKSAGLTRGQHLLQANIELFSELEEQKQKKLFDQMLPTYEHYLYSRWKTYMSSETTNASDATINDLKETPSPEGYGNVALEVIEALRGNSPKINYLNIRNSGAINGMHNDDIVEIPVIVCNGSLKPISVGEIPDHCLGLMKQVKSFEKATINSIENEDYNLALYALSIHPLIQDEMIARKILDQYISKHGSYFPNFKVK
jgi:6-phospho-beta-glucosidase